MRRAIRLLVAAAVTLAAAPACAQLAVTVEGAVARPGAQTLKAGARLLDAVRAAGVRADAYLLGAAWLHRGALAAQRERKAGLLFDLAVVEQGARLDGDTELAALVARLGEQVRALPVTGRRFNSLDPIHLELEAPSNRLLGDGDRLIFPGRPASITVTGAVKADCVPRFVGMRPATRYRADCPLHRDADSDWLYIVQPDGQVFRRGVALWNRDHDQALAPGARLVVPLRASVLKERAPGLNDALADFLASQPAGTAGDAR